MRACTSFRKPATRGEIELFSSTLKEKKSQEIHVNTIAVKLLLVISTRKVYNVGWSQGECIDSKLKYLFTCSLISAHTFNK